jgi:hypothetical protein
MRDGAGAERRIDMVEEKSRGDIGALLLVVPSISDARVDAGGCSTTRATGRRARKSPRIGLRASTSTTRAAAAKQVFELVGDRGGHPTSRPGLATGEVQG